MKPKKLFPRPNIITPALQLGLTDVSENKPTKNKTKQKMENYKKKIEETCAFFCNTERTKLFCV